MSYLIYIYNEVQNEDLDLNRVLASLENYCPFAKIEMRESFVSHFYSPELIKGLANAWNLELSGEMTQYQAENQRLYYEQQAYLHSETISPKIIYNGWQFLEPLQRQIPKSESSLVQLHIFLTSRLLVTKEEDEGRYHARTLIAGQPSIISSSGLVEAPARPVEFYFLQRAYQLMGQEIPDSEIKKRFQGKILTYNDKRLTEVIIGYILQAIAYRFWGEGFCDTPYCRLFNAHLQQEMLTAQLELPEFCPRHQTIFGQGKG